MQFDKVLCLGILGALCVADSGLGIFTRIADGKGQADL